MNILWLILFLTALSMSLVMIGFGWVFWKIAVDKEGWILGHRTARSMASSEAWRYAQVTLGRLWFFGGAFLLSVSLIVFFLVTGKEQTTTAIVGSVALQVQGLWMVASLLLTEGGLRRKFDQEGRKKN